MKTAIKSIRFTGLEVRAVLDGRKTMTRRLVKPQPLWNSGALEFTNVPGWWTESEDSDYRNCPCGVVGDRLWVRESWCVGAMMDSRRAGEFVKKVRSIWYPADGDKPDWCGRTRHARFMPRWASRITLEITGVKVERLQEITPEDAIAEGCCPSHGNELDKPEIYRAAAEMVGGPYPRGVFAYLWNQLHGPDSWELNPWAWCISFRRVTGER